ncbi:hypothetical protein M501DRAFT_941299 [Patellaria atrata CBS 101060]|uniref:Zn(2)-C6 fungal-type domain-containing protein n=1 Tax=Patellaria atrata CBS 101060 TaxID=1346257 RepID=A0A9P4VMW0_9PEZI|nr:hypothetical protein M501DRAFT_941299 [Patellaria atrata CBS 101060]
MPASSPLFSKFEVTVNPRSGGSHSPTNSARIRHINSCLNCRRRKVRCDHKKPTCSSCQRGNHTCSYATSTAESSSSSIQATASDRTSSRPSDIKRRLQRLENLVQDVVKGHASVVLQKSPDNTATCRPRRVGDISPVTERHEFDIEHILSEQTQVNHTSSTKDETLSIEDGEFRFNSSLYRDFLTNEERDTSSFFNQNLRTNSSFTDSQPGCANYPMDLFRSSCEIGDLSSYYPKDREECYMLFDVFLNTVEPEIKILHLPTFRKSFDFYVSYIKPTPYETTRPDAPQAIEDEQFIRHLEPLAFSVFFCAASFMKSSTIYDYVSIGKASYVAKYERGTQLAMTRADLMKTRHIEVLQAFLLYMSCCYRANDMEYVWSLVGLAHRIALSQGLHKDPSTLPMATIDDVTAEVRRRMWAHLCYLDIISAETQGQEPTIWFGSSTTTPPHNIDDETLCEGVITPGGVEDVPTFTDMTLPCIRVSGNICLRRIVQYTSRVEQSVNGMDRRAQLVTVQELYLHVWSLIQETVKHNTMQYTRFCDPSVPAQKAALQVQTLLESKAWVTFWSCLPRPLREELLPREVRFNILERAIHLIEVSNSLSPDVQREDSTWHPHRFSAIQAITHVLSEMRLPAFQGLGAAAFKLRALKAIWDCDHIHSDSQFETIEVTEPPSNSHFRPQDPLFDSSSLPHSGYRMAQTMSASAEQIHYSSQDIPPDYVSTRDYQPITDDLVHLNWVSFPIFDINLLSHDWHSFSLPALDDDRRLTRITGYMGRKW